MKAFMTMVLLSALNTAFASETCLQLASSKALKKAAKTLSVSESELRVRYVGGESFDGDVREPGVYLEIRAEYFDVFLKSDEAATAKALTMYAAEIYEFSEYDTGKLLSCEEINLHLVDESEWEGIYGLYL